jgi:hypothetical protein
MPALTPLIRLPQEIKGVMKLIGINPGKRLNPVVGLGKAKQHGHKAAFPKNKFLRFLSAGDVPSGFLDATNEEFKIIIGTRQQRLLHVLKKIGSTCHGALLQGGHYVQEFFVKTALLEAVYKCQEL